MRNQFFKKNATLLRFTLIEILLVTATIMLLISVLLPSLSRAKGYAREVACMSNLRQIALGYKGYFTDNNAELPYVTTPGYDYYRFLDDFTPIYPYTGSSAKVYKCPSSQSPPMTYERLLNYQQDYLCGNDIQDIEQHSKKNNGHGNNIYDLDPSNNSPATKATIASKAPCARNCNQRVIYDRQYTWHMAKRSIMVASIDDMHCYKETSSVFPYWMLDEKGNIVTDDADWPDLGAWPQ